MERRVAVTGVGLICALGNRTGEVWSGLASGKNGVDFITRFDASGFPVRFAAEVKDFDPGTVLDRKDTKRVDVFIQYALSAAQEALAAAGFQITSENADRVGACVGSGIGGFTAMEREHVKFLKGGAHRISPFFIPSMLINLAPSWICIKFGAKGPNLAVSTACASGAHAVGEAFRMIQRGDVDAMICGGAESVVTPMGVGGFAAIRALSSRNDSPQRACRPFDAERDGFVIGEGAGICLLEELGQARARGARVLAELVGYGMSCDAFHVTQPDGTGDGYSRCMRKALKDAGVGPEEVGYINAHGTSTPYNDSLETLAIHDTFGGHAERLAVSSTKSMTGHLLGAAGGLEAGITALSLYHGLLPPTINYEVPDPRCGLDYVPNCARRADIEFAMSNSFAFGGTNVSLLFKRAD